MNSLIGKKVKILHPKYDGMTGRVVRDDKGVYTVILDHSDKYYLTNGDDIQIIEENMKTNHVTIDSEKLKQLIKENYKWSDYTLKGKVDIVTNLAHFENDKEILEFLEYMEED